MVVFYYYIVITEGALSNLISPFPNSVPDSICYCVLSAASLISFNDPFKSINSLSFFPILFYFTCINAADEPAFSNLKSPYPKLSVPFLIFYIVAILPNFPTVLCCI